MLRATALINTILALLLLALAAGLRLYDQLWVCQDWPRCDAAWWPVSGLPAQRWVQGMRYLGWLLGLGSLCQALIASQGGGARAAVRSWVQVLAAGGWIGLQSVQGEATQAAVVAGSELCAYLVIVSGFAVYFCAGITPAPVAAPRALGRFASAGGLLLAVATILGVATSARDAASACPDFPLCLGQWWPAVDYAGAVLRWTGVPGSEDERLMAAIAVHWLHRVSVLVAVLWSMAAAVWAAGAARRDDVSTAGVWLSGLLTAQTALGVYLIVRDPPLWLHPLHSLGAAAVLMAMTAVSLSCRRPLRASVAAAVVPHVEAAPAPMPVPVMPPPRPEAVGPPEAAALPVEGLVGQLRRRLTRTRSGLLGFLSLLPSGREGVDRALLDDIEAALLLADVGIDATREIVDRLRDDLEAGRLDADGTRRRVREQMLGLLQGCDAPLVIPENVRPYVILVVGVNGVGKTTTIGKLACRLKAQGLSVMLAAGDTFRAAAVEQLQTWGERNQVPVIAQQTGADSASVVFDALQAAKARGVDVLIADTAGRLHTKSNLMEELKKVKRILARLDAQAPHEVLMVIDATTGQNAIAQVRQFHEAVTVSGLVLTKLDGTAKGGVILALARQFGIPIRFIGLGEGIEDLTPFDAGRFIEALFAQDAGEATANILH